MTKKRKKKGDHKKAKLPKEQKKTSVKIEENTLTAEVENKSGKPEETIILEEKIHLDQGKSRDERKLADKKSSRFKKAIFLMLKLASGLTGVIVLAILVVIIVFGRDLPDINELKNIDSFPETSIIYDREGNILYEMYGDENRKYVSLSDISPYAIKATIAIEDKNFFSHMGFDLGGIVRAQLKNMQEDDLKQGASTITQQLARNVFLKREKTYERKIKELLLSLQIEFKYSKEEILEMYLNKISYGNNSYGIEAAAQTYFEKSAKDLTLAEAAILASLPNEPTKYSPYGSKIKELMGYCNAEADEIGNRQTLSMADIENTPNVPQNEPESIDEGPIQQEKNCTSPRDSHYVFGRKDLVLERMVKDNYITHEQMDEAWEEAQKIVFKKQAHIVKEPHFVFYVKELLEQKYGKEFIEKGGLHIRTTLDPVLQELAKKVISERAEINRKKYGVKNAALVAIDPKTGQILAMQGSLNYWDETIDGQVNVATSPRQPGSTFKPFVYAAAIENGGIGSGTILSDYKTYFGPGKYSPNNSDNGFKGKITIRQAIGSSRNIPAIKAYYVAGEEEKMLDFVGMLGMGRLEEYKNEINKSADERGWTFSYGPPMAIGTGEITLTELVGGYAAFANQGKFIPPNPIVEISDGEGKVIEEYKEEGKQVMDSQTAHIINSILSDVRARPAGSWRAVLTIPGKTVAAKTGTSNKKVGRANYPNNLLTVGYTPSLAVGVWNGNTDGSHVYYSAWGEYTAAPIWKQFMSEALKNRPDEPFSKPEGIIVSKGELYPNFTKWVNYDTRFVKLSKGESDKKNDEEKSKDEPKNKKDETVNIPEPDFIKTTETKPKGDTTSTNPKPKEPTFGF